MWLNMYEFVHENLAMCFWTLPALLLAGIMVVVALLHRRSQRKREEAFQEEMGTRYSSNIKTVEVWNQAKKHA